MAKPPTSVRSIRLPDELWVRLSEYAAAHDLSVNALVYAAVKRVGLQPEGPMETTIVYRAQTQPASFGPVRAKPGALLKKR